MNITRRRFFATTGLASAAALTAGRLHGDDAPKPVAPDAPPLPRELKRTAPPQDLSLVSAFVRAGHGQLAKVQEMVARDPNLVFAAWDWGDGDWETALGGAAHVGSRECARFLLAHGARIDAFCAAMLGQRAVLAELVAANPAVTTARGPHGFTLLYHVAISGDVAMAELLKPLLARDAADYGQALSAAVRDGHLPMTRWLFENGPVDPNRADALGKRPLTTALAKGFGDVADELRRHGAREAD